ncbi:MAG: helix-turn-helix transcriptional regulator [Clostridia bacterium]|nr:helix-turn-helix transcriptional regulator [Clostridia bacterium]
MITINQIREKLIEAIEQSGMKKSEIARKIDVSHQAIGQYLHQNRMPALDTFANLCVVLDIDPADILCTNEKLS